MVGTIRNVNYEKLGEAERRILDQEGINNSGSRSGMTMSMTTGTANGTETSGRPPTRSDSLRGDARQVERRKAAACSCPVWRCKSKHGWSGSWVRHWQLLCRHEARTALPSTHWRPVAQALQLRPEQVSSFDRLQL